MKIEDLLFDTVVHDVVKVSEGATKEERSSIFDSLPDGNKCLLKETVLGGTINEIIRSGITDTTVMVSGK